MSTRLSVREAKTHLSRIDDEVEAGAEIVIVRAGRPVAPRERAEELGQCPGSLGLHRRHRDSLVELDAQRDG